MKINEIPIKQNANQVTDPNTQVSAEEFNCIVDAVKKSIVDKLGTTTRDDEVYITQKLAGGTDVSETQLPKATARTPGIMSKDDKKKLDSLNPISGVEVAINEDSGDTRGTAEVVNNTIKLGLYNIKGDKGEKGDIGDPGITSAVVSVSDTTGIPNASVEIKDQELNIHFAGLKGEQGNSGFMNTDGAVEIVNNLIDGGAAKVLSAEMGKQLSEKMIQATSTNKETVNDSIIDNYYIHPNGNLVLANTFSILTYKASVGDTFVIEMTGSGTSAAWATYNSDSEFTSDTMVSSSGTIVEGYHRYSVHITDNSIKTLCVTSFRTFDLHVYKLEPLKDKVEEHEENIADNKDRIHYYDTEFAEPETLLEPSAIREGEYISAENGAISSYTGYNLHVYNGVQEGSLVILSIKGVKDSTGSYAYAIYSDIDNISPDTALQVGVLLTPDANGMHKIVIPEGGKVLAVTKWGENAIYEVYSSTPDIDLHIKSVFNDILGTGGNISDVVSNNTSRLDDYDKAFECGDTIEPSYRDEGKFISASNGTIASFKNYNIDIYHDLSIGDAYKLIISNNPDDTGSYTYAIYSDDETWDSSTLLKIGPILNISANGEHRMTIPEGGKTLVVTVWAEDRGAKYEVQKTHVNVEETIHDIVSSTKEPGTQNSKCYIEVDGDVLKYCTKYDENKDLIIHFRPCMNNNLVTFTNVGFAENALPYPSTDFTRPVTVVNSPGSDNIGPFRVSPDANVGSGVGGFCGANHCYNEVYGSEQIKTASSEDYTFYLDDIKVTDGYKGYGNSVKVITENIIYDPRIAPVQGESILSSPLIKEIASYVVKGSQIEVALVHKILKDVTIAKYYGMQSIFSGETDIITPNGLHTTWTNAEGITSFTHSEYPQCYSFSQKSEEGYENMVLLNVGLGNRLLINDSDPIFFRSTGKLYTTLITNNKFYKNDVIYWGGVYSWTKPIVDDEYNYIYGFESAGKKYIRICSKLTYHNLLVPMPPEYINKYTVNETENDLEITNYIGGCLIINANKIGTTLIEITNV